MLGTRGRTAIQRVGLSRPVALAVDDGLIGADCSVFDFGSGRGGDVAGLRAMGVQASGWAPGIPPEAAKSAGDVVNLGYVVNVIEGADDRAQVLGDAWQLARRLLVVAARLDWDIKASQALSFGDGVITTRGT